MYIWRHWLWRWRHCHTDSIELEFFSFCVDIFIFLLSEMNAGSRVFHPGIFIAAFRIEYSPGIAASNWKWRVVGEFPLSIDIKSQSNIFHHYLKYLNGWIDNRWIMQRSTQRCRYENKWISIKCWKLKAINCCCRLWLWE